MKKQKQNLRKTIFLLLIIGLTSLAAQAEEPWLSTTRTSVWFGTRQLQIDRTNQTSQLDFLNYADNYNPGGYLLLGISWQGAIKDRWLLTADVFTSDDIIPTSFQIKGQYKIFPWLRLGGGLLQYPFLITGYEQFFKDNDPLFYTDGGEYANSRQSEEHDLAVLLGGAIHFENKTGFITADFSMAYSSLIPSNADFNQKLVNGNLRRQLVYKREASSSFFLLPSFEAGLNLIKKEKGTLGLLISGRFYSGQRAINYTKLTRTWTEGNEISERSEQPKHSFQMNDLSVGFYWKFK